VSAPARLTLVVLVAGTLAGCTPGISASSGTLRSTSVAPDGTTTSIAGAGVGVSVFGDTRIGVVHDPTGALR
jgi:hypothetical protein